MFASVRRHARPALARVKVQPVGGRGATYSEPVTCQKPSSKHFLANDEGRSNPDRCH